MEVTLRRAFSPECLIEEACGACGAAFRVESVVAEALTGHGGVEIGPVCPECIRYLAERNPAQFPSFAAYEEALRRYPEPMFSSQDEVLRLEEGAAWEAFASSRIR